MLAVVVVVAAEEEAVAEAAIGVRKQIGLALPPNLHSPAILAQMPSGSEYVMAKVLPELPSTRAKEAGRLNSTSSPADS